MDEQPNPMNPTPEGQEPSEAPIQETPGMAPAEAAGSELPPDTPAEAAPDQGGLASPSEDMPAAELADEPSAFEAPLSAQNTNIQMPDGPPEVQRADFGPLDRESPATAGNANIELLLDVHLPVSIELGRTQMSISEILELGSGSVVELDKLAGEPVDIMVNNKPLAKGEVVVLDENFGVRITSLVSPRERLERLNGQ